MAPMHFTSCRHVPGGNKPGVHALFDMCDVEGFLEGMQRVRDTQVAKKRLLGVIDPEIDRRSDFSVEEMLSFQIVSQGMQECPCEVPWSVPAGLLFGSAICGGDHGVSRHHGRLNDSARHASTSIRLHAYYSLSLQTGSPGF